jgi:transcriptional regulator with XRE-family HTH domain
LTNPLISSIHAGDVATEDICVRLGKRIRTLRKSKGWNQDDLALHMGLGRTYISNVERGRKNPSLRTLEILAVGFGMSLPKFLDGI